jgi:hypothetical protein
MICHHIYEIVGTDICPDCGEETHEINWIEYNEANKEWLRRNPDAWRQVGWWSI